MSSPLIKLTLKNAAFIWNTEQDKAFNKLKDALSSDLCVACFDPKLDTRLKTDACLDGFGAILQQKHPKGWMIVACASRRLSASEKGYSITKLEAAALMWALEKYRACVLGKPLTVLVDHCALCVLGRNRPKSAQLARWAILLNEYDIKIEYVSGKLHADVDCLSRNAVESHDHIAERAVIFICLIMTHRQTITSHQLKHKGCSLNLKPTMMLKQ